MFQKRGFSITHCHRLISLELQQATYVWANSDSTKRNLLISYPLLRFCKRCIIGYGKTKFSKKKLEVLPECMKVFLKKCLVNFYMFFGL
jgi:hypothetical protein